MSLMTQVGLEYIARDRSRGGTNSFNRNLMTTSQSVQRLGSSLLSLAGVGGGLYMLGSVMRSGVTEARAFGKQMAEVSTMLSDQSMTLLPRYREQLRSMSKEFGEGTETLSKGLYDILSASIAPAKALDVLAVSARSAKAGITDTGIAADAITTILNSYSLEADRAGEISDKLFTIVKLGKTTFAELAPNIGKITALAATAGLSFDDLGANLATMTRAGVQTEIAVTSLRAIMLSFLKPQSDSIEMARRYGVELNSNTLRTIGLTGVIQKLKKATAEELAVIVPTSRAITGFAAAIQKADALTGDYDSMLNSHGATQKAFQKIADDSSFKLDQLEQEWIDQKRALGNIMIEPLIVVLQALNSTLEDTREVLKSLYGPAEKVLGVLSALVKLVPANILADAMEAANARAFPEHQTQYMPTDQPQVMSDEDMWLSQLDAAQTAGPELVAVSERTNAQILADTREQLASVRAMHDKTRMEKIQMLEDYKKAHFGHTAEIEEGEKLLNNEILAIQKSRLDAMKVYMAELREDMQSTALYMSEKYAEAARSIESSMSSAFESMIADGASLKDAAEGFFRDIGRAFAKMVSDMIARAIMAKAIGVFLGDGGGGGGVGSHHSGWVPDGVPSFHGGRGLKSNERVAVIENDELLAPDDQIIKSGRRGGMGGGGINFQPQIKMVIVRNEREAYFEAMNSAKGEKVIVHKMLLNRNLLS